MFPRTEEVTEMKITTIGIDLAKNVFQVHGVDERGKVVLRKQLRRDQMSLFFSNLAPCVIGMEACGSAHYWAKKLSAQGHTVNLMAPQFVKPYVKTNKNDAADAEAICEAVGRPNMHFVPVKTDDQQAVLALHRARQGMVHARTAQANQIVACCPSSVSSYRRVSATLPNACRTSLRTERSACPEFSVS